MLNLNISQRKINGSCLPDILRLSVEPLPLVFLALLPSAFLMLLMYPLYLGHQT